MLKKGKNLQKNIILASIPLVVKIYKYVCNRNDGMNRTTSTPKFCSPLLLDKDQSHDLEFFFFVYYVFLTLPPLLGVLLDRFNVCPLTP